MSSTRLRHDSLRKNAKPGVYASLGLLGLAALLLATTQQTVSYGKSAGSSADGVADIASYHGGDTLMKVAGFTEPFRKALVASLQQGRVADVPVAKGQHVDAGQVLIRLDTSLQVPRTEMARLEADSTVAVESAQVQLEYARDELDRLTRLGETTAASPQEIRQARATFETARLSRLLADQEHAQAVEAHRLEEEKLRQHELRAPFAGRVTDRLKEVGETVEELEGVIEICQVDRLRVKMDCPLTARQQVREGDELLVVPTDPQWPARIGKVTLVMPVADAGSQTFEVRLEVPNEDAAWIAGLMVTVELPDSRAATTRPGPSAAR